MQYFEFEISGREEKGRIPIHLSLPAAAGRGTPASSCIPSQHLVIQEEMCSTAAFLTSCSHLITMLSGLSDRGERLVVHCWGVWEYPENTVTYTPHLLQLANLNFCKYITDNSRVEKLFWCSNMWNNVVLSLFPHTGGQGVIPP